MNPANIQPKWEIEDIVNINRTEITLTLNRAPQRLVTMINIGIGILLINTIIVKGATFCQVIIREHFNQLRWLITGGNQKWKGATPNFNIIEINIINHPPWVGDIIIWDIKNQVINIIPPKVWII